MWRRMMQAILAQTVAHRLRPVAGGPRPPQVRCHGQAVPSLRTSVGAWHSPTALAFPAPAAWRARLAPLVVGA